MTTLTALALSAAIALYPETMEITALNHETDTVTMETATGYIYEMYGTEDYEIGDLVSLIMSDNGTPDITDDVIIEARYAGYSR